MVQNARQIMLLAGFTQQKKGQEEGQEQREEREAAARRQFKLAVQAAEEAKELGALRVFLAYQAARDREGRVWGLKVQQGAEQLLLVQIVWEFLERHLSDYRDIMRQAGTDPGRGEQDLQMQLLLLKVATRFFAHLERAFRITQDPQACRFYFEAAVPA